VAVPMCSMNQQTWSEVYDGRLTDPELLKEPQVFSRENPVEPVGVAATPSSPEVFAASSPRV